MRNLKKLKEQYEALGREIEALEKKKSIMGLPEDREKYWFPDSTGHPFLTTHLASHNSPPDKDIASFLGAFSTEKDCQLRIGTVRKLCPTEPFVPRMMDKHYFWDGGTAGDVYYNNAFNKRNLAQGNVFPYTEEGKKQCEEYGAKLMEWADWIIEKSK